MSRTIVNIIIKCWALIKWLIIRGDLWFFNVKSVARLWDWIKSSIPCVILRFLVPESYFLNRFVEDMVDSSILVLEY